MEHNEFSRQPRFLPEMPSGEIEILPPPSPPNAPDILWFEVVVPPLVMIAVTVVISMLSNSLYTLVSVIMTVMTLITSLISSGRQIRGYKKNKKLREKNYLQYVVDTRSNLSLSKKQQIDGMDEMNPSPDICIARIINIDSKLWERLPGHDDFISVRVGLGNIPFAIKLKYEKTHSFMEFDALINEPEKIALDFEKVNKVPLCLDLFNSAICGVAGDNKNVSTILSLIALQLITHHGYDDIRIVLILKESNLKQWEWIKFISHIWDDDFKTRFMICGKSMAHQTLSELNEILKSRELNNRKDSKTSMFSLPHYIFIVEDVSLLENDAISKYLFNPSKELGISTIFTAKNKAYLPTNCKTVINVFSNVGEYADKETGQRITFNLDEINVNDLDRVGRTLSSLAIKRDSTSFELPKSITLLELFGHNKIEELDIFERWSDNKTYKGMSVPIGIRADGKMFDFDMHETGYGPHGLVAGTTGSGKSELLQAIIISLAINYHPHDIAFVLIDYKGGGTADIFKDMPHLVGTITNLGGNQTTRALISIKSELQRRQRLFSMCGVNNIDKYQKLFYSGGVSIPLPHLIMIADEFAELKAEQPDFMKELVSAARVGRSLGIHLILATQKPAGVVDDQIWSNSKFKICLKVQDEADSNDVIKRPDAAMIKEPGRAFIQVGNDEVFELFQSAYPGADYDPDQEKLSSTNIDKSIFRVSLNGRCDKIYPQSEEKIAKVEFPTQLKVAVDYIATVAKTNNIIGLDGPWLPPLSEIIYLEEVIGQSDKPFSLAPRLGVADDPRNQVQSPLEFDFLNEGNLLIYGMQGSGKSVFLQTLCMVLAHEHSPADVNIYILDFGGTAFKRFERLPHVGGVITITEEEKLNQFILFIFRIIEERKILFEENSVDSFISLKEKANTETPAIFILIDNYFALSESYEDLDEEIIILSREGAKYGIYFVVTAINYTLIKYRFSINFKMAITFLLTEKDQYDSIVGRTEGLEPSPCRGRGLVRADSPLEFQTALPVFSEEKAGFDKESEEIALSEILSDGIEKIFSGFEGNQAANDIGTAREIPQMPQTISFADINKNNDSDDIINIGLMNEDLQLASIDLIQNNAYLFTGDRSTGKSTLLMSIAKYILANINSVVYAKDGVSMGIYKLMSIPNVTNIDEIDDFDDFASKISAEIEKRRTALNECKRNSGDVAELLNSFQQIVFVIDNIVEFAENDNPALVELLTQIVKKEFGLKITILCAASLDDACACYEDLVIAVKSAQCGVLFGSIKEQDLFDVRVPYYSYEKKFDIGEGYLIIKNKFDCIKVAN